MEKVKISSLITDKISGEWGTDSLTGDGVNVIRTANFTNSGTISFHNIVKREIENKVVEKKKLIDGDIIIEKSGGSPSQPVGRVVYFESPDKSIYLCNNFTTVLRPNREKINPKYLFYLLYNFYQTDKVLSFQNKTTGIINLKLDRYLDAEITYDSELETQNKIVAILDKAKAILYKREETVKKYDELLRATFLEMFGDPVTNRKGFNQVLLREKNYFKIQGGGTPSKSKDEYYGSEIPWVTPKDMKFDLIENSKIKLSSLGLENSTAKLIKPFSTLVVVRSGILKHSLPVGITLKDVTINQDLKAITPLKTKPFFTYWNIKLFEKFLLEKVRAVTADNIDSDILLSISILFPEESKQLEFEQIARTFYKCKEKVMLSKSKIENLIESITQLAFNGELYFNTAVDLEVLLENDYWFFKENSNTKSIQLLLERLNTDELNVNKFYEQQTYDKAKSFVFELMKEGKVKQVFDEKAKKVKLTTE